MEIAISILITVLAAIQAFVITLLTTKFSLVMMVLPGVIWELAELLQLLIATAL